MKKAIVVGKGPSVQQIPAWTDHSIVALNEATIYCPRVDYLFVADIETLDNISMEEMLKVDTLVIPAHPWISNRQYPDLTYLDLLARAPGVNKFIVYEGRLENPEIEPFPWLPRISDTVSTGDTAIEWLLQQNYTQFVLSGLDPSGGYIQRSMNLAERLNTSQQLSLQCPSCQFEINADVSVKHACATPQPQEWYRAQYQVLVDRIESNQATYQRLGDMASCELQL